MIERRHITTRAILVTAMMATIVMVLQCSCNRGNSKRINDVLRNMPSRDEEAPYDGIDISSYQGYIDWNKVSSDKNIRFVYIKASEGATYRSPHYAHNVSQARRNGMLVGSYHYLTSTSTIDEQFSNFSNYALKSVQDLVPMLDVEVRGTWSRSELLDSVDKFCTLVEHHYGIQPMIYSTMEFYNKNLTPHFNNHLLYIGRYANEPPEINWEGQYAIWQFSETGIIPGIDAYVDLCRFHKDSWVQDIVMK